MSSDVVDVPRMDILQTSDGPMDASSDGDGAANCTTDNQCADGVFCNGVERCLPGAPGADARGCVLANPANPCMGAQTCNEATHRCDSPCDTTGDTDGDGQRALNCGGSDCDDADPSRFPGNVEVCDSAGHDEDCDPNTFGARDGDGDGYPDHACCNTDSMSQLHCGDDCDDTHGNQHPGLAESCDARDNDCNGMIDEGVLRTFFPDMDNDGYGDLMATPVTACNPPAGHVERMMTGDCNDTNATIRPNAPELCDAAMVDENCDGVANPPMLCTCVGDISRTCMLPGACAAGMQRCVDGLWGACSIGPTTESCNGVDDDCDGMIDETLTVTCYADSDNDGYPIAGATPVQACPVTGREPVGGCPTNQTNRAPTAATTDCAPLDAAVSPGAMEVCDGGMTDENCDGMANPPSLCACSGSTTRACPLPGACAAGTQTCSGGAWSPCSVSPVTDVCNGIDDDCDGTVDEMSTVTCYTDDDNDGYAATGAVSVQSCPITGRDALGGCPIGQTNRPPLAATADCMPMNVNVNPAASEVCDAALVDEDCDGIANPTSLCACSGSSTRSCSLPGVCAAGTQTCASGSWGQCSIQPGTETCNGTDDNCNGTVDEGLSITCYVDGDNDAYPDPGATRTQTCPVAGRGSVGGCPSNLTNRAPTIGNVDCAPANASINPNATEACDTGMVDENCSGTANEGCTCTAGTTQGCQLAGACARGTELCGTGGAWGACSISPATEVCNAVDDDCDGTTDEGLLVACYADGDNDGYAASGAPARDVCPDTSRPALGNCPLNYTNRAPAMADIDCSPAISQIHPGASEVCDTMLVDEDCDGTVDEGCSCLGTESHACPLPGACAAGTQTCISGAWGACTIQPVLEWCNEIDDDCDGTIDEGVTITCFADDDNDTYAAAGVAAQQTCSAAGRGAVGGCPDRFTNREPVDPGSIDCNDTASGINPVATEACNNVDDNCDGRVDEGARTTYYRDEDGDMRGNPAQSVAACALPTGYVTNNVDCDDTRASVYAGAAEICDGIDNNCNTTVDEALPTYTFYRDADGDGHGNAAVTTTSCGLVPGYVTSPSDDCNDTRNDIYPGLAEVCDGVDNDCDTLIDEGVSPMVYYVDSDGDGYGNSSMPTAPRCSPMPGLAPVGGDCNDGNPSIRPNAAEVCNGVDENCNSLIDEGVLVTTYPDADGDGRGAMVAGSLTCPGAPGRSATNNDCNDSNNQIYPGAAELCDGLDTNCDGVKNGTGEDDDNDGYADVSCGAACNPSVPGALCNDCDDTSFNTHPGATDATGTGTDENCDGREYCYVNADDDGYRTTATVLSVGNLTCRDSGEATALVPTGDCCDTDARAHPGVVAYFTTARTGCGGYDFNCVSGTELQYPSTESLNCSSCPGSGGAGWRLGVGIPGCGIARDWAANCWNAPPLFNCTEMISTQTQGCR